MDRPAVNGMYEAMLDMQMLLQAFEGIAWGPEHRGDVPGWLWSVRRAWEGVEAAWEGLEAVEQAVMEGRSDVPRLQAGSNTG